MSGRTIATGSGSPERENAPTVTSGQGVEGQEQNRTVDYQASVPAMPSCLDEDMLRAHELGAAADSLILEARAAGFRVAGLVNSHGTGGLQLRSVLWDDWRASLVPPGRTRDKVACLRAMLQVFAAQHPLARSQFLLGMCGGAA